MRFHSVLNFGIPEDLILISLETLDTFSTLQGHRYKLNYDGMHYLTISNTKISDAGEVSFSFFSSHCLILI